MAKILSGEVIHAGTLNGNPLCLAASKWCLDQVKALGAAHPAGIQKLGQRLMAGLTALAQKHGVPLRPQGPGLIFHTVMLKPGATEGAVSDYRDYVRRHDAARWAHLRRCLLEEGVRAIERGIWSISLAHAETDIDEALIRSARAFRRHAAEWTPPAG
jgi:glutamate-1-semialdehyde 2,1-aminomutase